MRRVAMRIFGNATLQLGDVKLRGDEDGTFSVANSSGDMLRLSDQDGGGAPDAPDAPATPDDSPQPDAPATPDDSPQPDAPDDSPQPDAPDDSPQPDAPATPDESPFVDLLGDTLLAAAGVERSTAELLAGKTCVLLYFGGLWCVPCVLLSPQIVEAYDASPMKDDVAIVFVSAGEAQEEFDAYYRTMVPPFYAVPWSPNARRETLTQLARDAHGPEDAGKYPQMLSLDGSGNVLEAIDLATARYEDYLRLGAEAFVPVDGSAPITSEIDIRFSGFGITNVTGAALTHNRPDQVAVMVLTGDNLASLVPVNATMRRDRPNDLSWLYDLGVGGPDTNLFSFSSRITLEAISSALTELPVFNTDASITYMYKLLDDNTARIVGQTLESIDAWGDSPLSAYQRASLLLHTVCIDNLCFIQGVAIPFRSSDNLFIESRVHQDIVNIQEERFSEFIDVDGFDLVRRVEYVSMQVKPVADGEPSVGYEEFLPEIGRAVFVEEDELEGDFQQVPDGYAYQWKSWQKLSDFRHIYGSSYPVLTDEQYWEHVVVAVESSGVDVLVYFSAPAHGPCRDQTATLECMLGSMACTRGEGEGATRLAVLEIDVVECAWAAPFAEDFFNSAAEDATHASSSFETKNGVNVPSLVRYHRTDGATRYWKGFHAQSSLEVGARADSDCVRNVPLSFCIDHRNIDAFVRLDAGAIVGSPLNVADADADPQDDDADGDGVGDNADAFPNDENEWADADGDGVGDNADAFPNDPNETADTDGDGVGDNADASPFGSITLSPAVVFANSVVTVHVDGAPADESVFTFLWTLKEEVLQTVLVGRTNNSLDLADVQAAKGQDIEAKLFKGDVSRTVQGMVSNSPPVIQAVTILPRSGVVGQTLVCSADATDADADALEFIYEWHDGSNGPTYTIKGTDIPNDVLSCTVFATDGEELSAPVVATATVLEPSPEGGGEEGFPPS